MPFDISKAVRTERRKTVGQSYTVYFFNCIKCGVEISTQHSFAKKHSGLCCSCSHKGRPYQSAYTQLLGNSRRGIDVSLTYEEFISLCESPRCHYCGATINRSLTRGEPGYRGYFLDRMDNAKGYSKSNCVPCCWSCNQAKGNRYSYDEFLAISQLLASVRTKPKSIDSRSEFLALNGFSED